eukprot:Nk52_evm8s157 gene=Nk52_evmTU8s157
MSLKAQYDICVDIFDFWNVDLFHKGLYSVRVSMRSDFNRRSTRPYLVDIYQSNEQKRRCQFNPLKPNSKDRVFKFPQLINLDYSFATRSFRLDKPREHIPLRDGCHFTIELKVPMKNVETIRSLKELLLNLDVELWFSPSTVMTDSVDQLHRVSTRTFKLNLPYLSMFYHAGRIPFEYIHFSTVNILVQGSLSLFVYEPVLEHTLFGIPVYALWWVMKNGGDIYKFRFPAPSEKQIRDTVNFHTRLVTSILVTYRSVVEFNLQCKNILESQKIPVESVFGDEMPSFFFDWNNRDTPKAQRKPFDGIYGGSGGNGGERMPQGGDKDSEKKAERGMENNVPAYEMASSSGTREKRHASAELKRMADMPSSSSQTLNQVYQEPLKLNDIDVKPRYSLLDSSASDDTLLTDDSVINEFSMNVSDDEDDQCLDSQSVFDLMKKKRKALKKRKSAEPVYFTGGATDNDVFIDIVKNIIARFEDRAQLIWKIQQLGVLVMDDINDLFVQSHKLLMWHSDHCGGALPIYDSLSRECYHTRVLRLYESTFFEVHDAKNLCYRVLVRGKKHSDIARILRKRKYFSYIEPTSFENGELDGEENNVPLIFEDRYIFVTDEDNADSLADGEQVHDQIDVRSHNGETTTIANPAFSQNSNLSVQHLSSTEVNGHVHADHSSRSGGDTYSLAMSTAAVIDGEPSQQNLREILKGRESEEERGMEMHSIRRQTFASDPGSLGAARRSSSMTRSRETADEFWKTIIESLTDSGEGGGYDSEKSREIPLKKELLSSLGLLDKCYSPREVELMSRVSNGYSPYTGGNHLVVLVHGLSGNRYDLRMFRLFLSLCFDKMMFLSTDAIEGQTYSNIESLATRVCNDIIEYINASEHLPQHISFVGHSLGNIVIRQLLSLPQIEPLLSRMHTYISIQGPHTGMLYSKSALVSQAMVAMQFFKNSEALKQLRFSDKKNPRERFLYRLSKSNSLGCFRNIVFVSSPQDKYVPTHSARVEFSRRAQREAARHKPTSSHDSVIQMEIVKNIAETLVRFGVQVTKLDVVYHAARLKSLNETIGRAAHVALLEDEVAVQKLILSVCRYFIPHQDECF